MKKVIFILLKIKAVVETSEDKHFRAPVGFESITAAYPARCYTKPAIKPLILGSS